jgi:hypothetical protein
LYIRADHNISSESIEDGHGIEELPGFDKSAAFEVHVEEVVLEKRLVAFGTGGIGEHDAMV